MSSPTYLAIDIGASSGRHLLATLEGGRISTREIYRFPNGVVDRSGTLCWDSEALFSEILNGLKACQALGIVPTSIGIDTWGVDFALLDADDRLLGPTVAYRDSRTEGAYEVIDAKISPEALYAATGIQRQPFNTICQLVALQRDQPELLAKARSLLMMPDYFHWRLTGVKRQEYTNATTSQLVHAASADWDRAVIRALGLPDHLFEPLSMPGEAVGCLRPEIAEAVGFNTRVVLPPTHDTASAVVAVPAQTDALYISSGTWSLLGAELPKPETSEAARKGNFTNEGGYLRRYRFLKNIMGLWMLQSVKKEFEAEGGNPLTFDQLSIGAQRSAVTTIIDCNQSAYFAPTSMREAIREGCRQVGGPIPETPGDFASVVYRSLADRYAKAVEELEQIVGKRYDTLHIVGGGSKDSLLNAMTAQATGKEVWTGPTEGTALGNLAVQMIADGRFPSLAEARAAIGRSFDVRRV